MVATRWVVSVFTLAIAVFGIGTASAQSYPDKPIRIVTAGAGGGSDFMARQIAGGISGPLGQAVIVENRGGVVTAETLAKAAPDGYTLSLNGNNTWITPLLQKTTYDVERDFAPIVMITREVSVLAVNPSLPVKSTKELIALAKAKPGELNYGSDAPGGRARLAAEIFKTMAGVNIVNVPYKGNAAALTALMAGEVQMMITDPLLAAPQVKSGKLRVLGVTSAEPSPLVPGMPTVAATGLPGYEATGVSGMFAPAKTPRAVIDRLNREVVRFLSQPDVKERFLNAGLEAVTSTPEQFAAFIKADTAKWGKAIEAAGIKRE